MNSFIIIAIICMIFVIFDDTINILEMLIEALEGKDYSPLMLLLNIATVGILIY